MTNQLQLTES
nr:unnamed protein product [Callosobruchus analis]